CFAQHISRSLVGKGFTYYVVEPAPPWLPAADRARYNFEVFSARYGNVYTALQLLQLFETCMGRREPADAVWRSPDGRWFDLLRPRVQPDGFASRDELLTDRVHHRRAVRRMFEVLDVFVFTLGLTEAWVARADGTVYPVAPGCGAGEFSPDRYALHNFTAGEVAAHLGEFLAGLRAVNPAARVVLTVSPVPLAATAGPRHVLQATAYSKAALRVATEEVVTAWPGVAYFGSYEIITATGRAHEYFAADRRTVTPAGVGRVMEVFFEHFAGVPAAAAPPPAGPAPAPAADREVVCDEAAVLEALARRPAA
ncbi:MAG TPA: GSCFA domain-containing protein, partial [Gemmataceae bacterium]|nr:GSCFA domain-containing protein [Gemmataceae bacterium]